MIKKLESAERNLSNFKGCSRCPQCTEMKTNKHGKLLYGNANDSP